MDNRSRLEVDGASRLVGTDQEVRVLVLIQVHPGRQGPAEGADRCVDVAGIDDLFVCEQRSAKTFKKLRILKVYQKYRKVCDWSILMHSLMIFF